MEYEKEFFKSLKKMLPYSRLNAPGRLLTAENIPLFKFFPYYSDLHIKDFEQLVEKSQSKKINIDVISPTTLRKELLFAMFDGCAAGTPAKVRQKIFKDSANLLRKIAVTDIFSLDGNFAHNAGELALITSNLPWNSANAEQKIAFGNLYVALHVLSESLFTYVFTDGVVEHFGPYDVSDVFGKGRVLVVTKYRNLQGGGLWKKISKINEMNIFSIHKGNNISFNFLNQIQHSFSLYDSLEYFVVSTGKGIKKIYNTSNEINELAYYIAEVADKQYMELTALYPEEFKKKLIEIRDLRLGKLAELTRTKFHTKEYYERVENREALSDIFSSDEKKFSAQLLSFLKCKKFPKGLKTDNILESR